MEKLDEEKKEGGTIMCLTQCTSCIVSC